MPELGAGEAARLVLQRRITQVERLFRSEAERLEAAAHARLRDPHAAQEAVQEAFAAAVADLPDGLTDEEAGGWLFRVVRNKAVDHVRAEARRTRAAWAPSDDATVGDVAAVVVARWEGATLLALLGELEPRERQLLTARVLDELPIGMIAANHEVTPGSARVLIARARKRLRALAERSHLHILVPVSLRNVLTGAPGADPAPIAYVLCAAILTTLAGLASTGAAVAPSEVVPDERAAWHTTTSATIAGFDLQMGAQSDGGGPETLTSAEPPSPARTHREGKQTSGPLKVRLPGLRVDNGKPGSPRDISLSLDPALSVHVDIDVDDLSPCAVFPGGSEASCDDGR